MSRNWLVLTKWVVSPSFRPGMKSFFEIKQGTSLTTSPRVNFYPHFAREFNFFIIFQVHPGETLAGIAIKYNLTLEDLKQNNNLLTDSDLTFKSHLIIPCQDKKQAEENSFLSDNSSNSAMTDQENKEKLGKILSDKKALTTEDYFASFDAKVASFTDQTEKIIKQMKK